MLHTEPNLAACSVLQVTKAKLKKKKKNSVSYHVILGLKSNCDIKII